MTKGKLHCSSAAAAVAAVLVITMSWAKIVTGQSCVDVQDFENVVLKLTVALGKAGQFDEARVELHKVENYESHMSKVIVQVYSKNFTNTENCVELLYGVNCDAYANGVHALYKEMRDNEHLSKPQILLLVNQLDSPGCAQNSKVNETLNGIKPHVNKVLSDWAADIRHGNYSHIYHYAVSSEEQYNSLGRQLSTLIRKAFARNTENLNATLAFVRYFPYLRFVAPGYLTILQELKLTGKNHSEEMLMTGYRIYETMSSKAAQDKIAAIPDLQELFDQLKGEIPPVIRNIFWGKSCTVKNLFWKEYLHAAKEFNKYTGVNGLVFTWLTGYKVTAAEWIFEPIIFQDKLYFQVKNRQLMKLKPSNDNDGEESYYLCESVTNSGKVATCNGKSGAHKLLWIVLPATYQESGTAFTLKNIYTTSKTTSSSISSFWGLLARESGEMDTEQDGFYLQATKEFNLGLKRREVKDELLEDSSHWQIDCF